MGSTHQTRVGRRGGAFIALVLLVAGVGHVVAPVARAECDGGITYKDAVPWASGGFVGVIRETKVASYGIEFASAIAVEATFDTEVGSIYRGRVLAGWCADDYPTVGRRVVVLLGVRMNGTGDPIDVFYTEGRTVSRATSPYLRDLPATDTIEAPATGGRGLPFPQLAGMLLGLLVLFRRLDPVIRRHRR